MKKKKLVFHILVIQLINVRSKKIGLFMAPKIIFPEELIKSCDIGLSSVMIRKI